MSTTATASRPPFSWPSDLEQALSPFVVNLGHRPTPAFDLYIGRTFAGRTDIGFGNPLRLRHETPRDRAELIVDYWAWLNGPTPPATALRRRIRSGELDGKVLACWCAGKGLCHGHVLAALANGYTEQLRSAIAQLHTELTES